MTGQLPEGLAGKVVAVDRALQDADIPHAFGGALALAYYAEPRATNDIDVNVAVPAERAGEVLAVLPQCVGPDEPLAVIERDGQIRLWWDHTPVDLFFRQHEFHDWLDRNAGLVLFGDVEIPIISGEGLMVCKALFNRPKDWVDIDAMLTAGEIHPEVARLWLVRLVGADDERLTRLDELVARHGPGTVPARLTDAEAARWGPPAEPITTWVSHGSAADPSPGASPPTYRPTR